MAPSVPAKKKRDFDPKKFLATIGEGRRVVSFPRKQTIFTQGDAADSVFYIQEGKVRLTVVSKIGKEAILGILSEGEFFGEGGLAGQPLRMGSATAMTDYELLRIDNKAMALALHREHAARSRSRDNELERVADALRGSESKQSSNRGRGAWHERCCPKEKGERSLGKT